MRLRNSILVIVVTLSLIAAIYGFTSPSRAASQDFIGQKWSYITLVYNFDEHSGAVLMADVSQLIDINMSLATVPAELAGGGEIAYYLDYLGGLGYELVSSVPYPDEAGRSIFFFKRPLS